MNNYLNEFIGQLIKKTPDEQNFHQAVREVFENVMPVIEAEAKYHEGIVRMNGINFETEIKIVVEGGSDGSDNKVIIIE